MNYITFLRFAKFFAFSLFVFVFTAACAATESAVAENVSNEWNPKKTRVFMVGLLEWQDAENLKPFPQENRRDDELINALRRRGVPEDQIYKLKDKTATTSRIQNVFENFNKFWII